ncbi:Aldehyde dehydrogenase [Mycoplasmoides gallisepticum S6]|uniref:Aldehyde dehydrogenase n=1 Tax=Mycoplasmoides gallisepticum S6 TaxID=1006581 RepID=A0A0F6CM40_MYCGL|nr:Aldehyde dehydrogenase [Mycoplasmoides gallisepticum S6]
MVVHKDIYNSFINELIKQLEKLNLNANDMTHIINEQHMKRLERLISKTPKEKIIY